MDNIESSPTRGKVVTAISVLVTLALLFAVINALDKRPRTHDAHLFAFTAGIAPEVSGRVIEVNVTNGSRVKKGDVLFRIDPEPFELRLRQAKSQVASLRAQIDLTTRQVASQTSGANAASTQTNRAREQLRLARDTLARLEPLLGNGYVTEQQVDEAQANERTAEAALLASIQQATQARQAVGDTASLMEQLAGAEAAEALATRDLRESTVIAPFDGQVVGLQFSLGTFATAGHPFFTMVNDKEWYAIADFRETDLRNLRPGQSATVWVMGFDGQPLHGQVESIGVGVEPEDQQGPGLPVVGRTLNWVVVAQRFPIWIRLDGAPEGPVRIGATASVKVQP